MIPVSIIVPMRNSSTTILETLRSIQKQQYPVSEVFVIDNKSTDNSVPLVSEFMKTSTLTIELIRRKENKGVGASYNLGVSQTKSAYVILMHSDSSLLSSYEIAKLIKPIEQDRDVVASYSTILLPQKVWETYNFWQKCLFVQSVGKESPGLNGKFDCIKRDIFEKIGGFNLTFGQEKFMGGEDADLHFRLRKEGKVVLSKAKVVHLHYLGKGFKLIDWIRTRKLLARTYGRLLRAKRTLHPIDIFILALKPFLALLPFVPGFHMFGIALLVFYAFSYPWKMYTYPSSMSNPRILILPFIHIFLLYYEAFWMIEAFLATGKKV